LVAKEKDFMQETKKINFYDRFDIKINNRNIREISEKLSENFRNKFTKILLIVNSGTDSQIIIHSLIFKEVSFECLFFYMPGVNDDDYYFIKFLEYNYNIKIKIQQIEQQNLQKSVCKILQDYIDNQYFVINSIIGPGFIKENNKIYEIEYTNFIEQMLKSDRYIIWSKFSSVYDSIMKDSILKDFLCSFLYFEKNNFLNCKISEENYWDRYIKMHLYSKYWKDDLFYFPSKEIFSKSVIRKKEINLIDYNK
jgi:hypothetical protein